MPALAITGTIGSGKSSAVASLAQLLGAETFSADEANRQLLNEDPDVRQLIIASLGRSSYMEDGIPDRDKISDLIRSSQAKRDLLESILHPRLQQIWKPKAEKYRKLTNSFFIAEIPLLYEKQLENYFSRTILVASSDSTRQRRLQDFRALSRSQIESWSKIQDSENSKIPKADHILWNDGSPAALHQQIQLLALRLLQS